MTQTGTATLTRPASIHDDNEDAQNVGIQTQHVTDFADGYELTLPPHSINVITWNSRPCYDVTGDDQVTIAGVQAVAGRWQNPALYASLFDVVPDGIIDVRDVMRVAAFLGEGCGSASPIP